MFFVPRVLVKFEIDLFETFDQFSCSLFLEMCTFSHLNQI